jgi:DoxX-like family
MTIIDATANSESGIVTEQIPATTKQDKTAVLLWIVQGLLALIFLFAGAMKLIVPVELVTKQMPLPGMFLRFIGVAEVLGTIGG